MERLESSPSKRVDFSMSADVLAKVRMRKGLERERCGRQKSM
jgi:hypothetical protein